MVENILAALAFVTIAATFPVLCKSAMTLEYRPAYDPRRRKSK